MTQRKYVRVEPGERFDAPEMKRVASTTPVEGETETNKRLLQGTDATLAGYVIDGFAITNTSGKIVTVAAGTALMSLRFEGRTYSGFVGTGPAARSIDVAGYTNGAAAHGVYVRATLRPDESNNRYFWDAAVTPALEVGRGIPTRYTEDWDIHIEEASPGSEWMKIGEIVPDTLDAAGAGVTDMRQFFFEGDPAQAYEVVDAEWGGGNDRNNDRALYGVKGFRRAMRAVFRKIGEMQGQPGGNPARWWLALSTNSIRSLYQLANEKLDRAGGATSTVTGIIRPDASVTRDLGTTAVRFLSFFTRYLVARNIVLGDLELGSAADALLPRIYAAFSNTVGRNRMQLLLMEKDAAPAGSEIRVYAVRAGYAAGISGGGTYYLEIAVNCQASAIDEWSFGDAAQDAVVYCFTARGFGIVRRAAAAATPWADDATGWTLRGMFDTGTNPALYTAGQMSADLGTTIPAAQNYAFTTAVTVRRTIAPNTGVPGNGSGWTNMNPGTSNSATDFRARHLAASGAGPMMYPLDVPDGAVIIDAVVRLDTTLGGGVTALNIIKIPHTLAAATPMKAADVTVPGDGVADHTITVDAGNPVTTDTHSYALWVYSDAACINYIDGIEWRFSHTKLKPA